MRSVFTTVPCVRRLIPTESDSSAPVREDDAETPEGDPPCGKVGDLDVEANVATEARPTPPGRPWVVVNMVASIDGASSGPDQKSGTLSSDDDRALFHALRSVADVILAGAGTVRAENYGAPKGKARLAVVSASLSLDPAARFFQEPDHRPIVLTTSDAVDSGRATPELQAVADIRPVGTDAVAWPEALTLLREEYDTKILLVEGGPTLNGQLVAADVIDEFRLTLSPLLVGGEARRIVAHGPPVHGLLPFRLDGLVESDSFLFLRYVRDRH